MGLFLKRGIDSTDGSSVHVSDGSSIPTSAAEKKTTTTLTALAIGKRSSAPVVSLASLTTTYCGSGLYHLMSMQTIVDLIDHL